jgi:hypothetical protein
MNEEYAIQIARDWNVPASGSGFVTKFAVKTSCLSQYEIQNVGGEIHNELWVPAENLGDLNDNIVGEIIVTIEFFENEPDILGS